MEEIKKETIELEDISNVLNGHIDFKEGVPLTKALVRTNIERGLKVCIETGDHIPIHIHIKNNSNQTLFRLQFDPIKSYEDVYDSKYLAYSIEFFKENPKVVEHVKERFKHFNPQLNYE